MIGLGAGASTSSGVEAPYVTLTATTGTVTDITDTGATFNGSYSGGSNVISCGLEISANSSMSPSFYLTVAGIPNSFSIEFPVLVEGFTYYYRAFAQDGTTGVVTGSISNFTLTGTPPPLPNLPDPEPVYTPNWNRGTATDTNLDYWSPFFSVYHEPLEVLESVTDETGTTKRNVVRVQRNGGTTGNTVGLALFEAVYSSDTVNQFAIEAGATYRIIFDAFIPSDNDSTETGSLVQIEDQATGQWFAGSDGYTSSDTGRWKTVTVDLDMPDPLVDTNGQDNLIISAESDTSDVKDDKFFIANLAMYKV